MQPSNPIAILEDSFTDRVLIEELLTANNYSFKSFETGKPLITDLRAGHKFSLLLLDWEVPGTNGIDILNWVSENLKEKPPAIFITNRTLESDLIYGLNAGANDYITKPVSIRELLARINVQLRNSPYGSIAKPDTYTIGVFTVNTITRKITVFEESVYLSPKEFDLANLFLSNPWRLFSRDEINMQVWGRQIPVTSRTLDTHLSHIRKKLNIGKVTNTYLNASYTLGYRLELLDE